MPDIGEYVSPGTEVARLIDMSKLKIYVYVPENDVKYLKLGQTVDVYVAEIGRAFVISMVYSPRRTGEPSDKNC